MTRQDPVGESRYVATGNAIESRGYDLYVIDAWIADPGASLPHHQAVAQCQAVALPGGAAPIVPGFVLLSRRGPSRCFERTCVNSAPNNTICPV